MGSIPGSVDIEGPKVWGGLSYLSFEFFFFLTCLSKVVRQWTEAILNFSLSSSTLFQGYFLEKCEFRQNYVIIQGPLVLGIGDYSRPCHARENKLNRNFLFLSELFDLCTVAIDFSESRNLSGKKIFSHLNWENKQTSRQRSARAVVDFSSRITTLLKY